MSVTDRLEVSNLAEINHSSRKFGPRAKYRLKVAAALIAAPIESGGLAMHPQPIGNGTMDYSSKDDEISDELSHSILEMINALPMHESIRYKECVDWVESYDYGKSNSASQEVQRNVNKLAPTAFDAEVLETPSTHNIYRRARAKIREFEGSLKRFEEVLLEMESDHSQVSGGAALSISELFTPLIDDLMSYAEQADDEQTELKLRSPIAECDIHFEFPIEPSLNHFEEIGLNQADSLAFDIVHEDDIDPTIFSDSDEVPRRRESLGQCG